MKTITIQNGEVRIAYELLELSIPIIEKILLNRVRFQIETMTEDSPYYYLFEQMELSKTPFFLESEIYSRHRSDLIETIIANKFLFSEDGEILPIYYLKDDKTVYGMEQYPCVIS